MRAFRPTTSETSMTFRFSRLLALSGAFLVCGSLVYSQHSSRTERGTIEESWRTAPTPAPAPKPTPIPSEPSVWRSQRRPAPAHLSGWQDGPTRSLPPDVYVANEALIDSLEHSHCINATYATTLRARNTEARSLQTPVASREFAYGTTQPRIPSPPPTSALTALHRELVELLDLCYGAGEERP